MACYYGDEALARALVAKRANVRAVDRKGRQPLDLVRDRRHAFTTALGL
jgi:hypothetical protein